jgi:hypothetical protein
VKQSQQLITTTLFLSYFICSTLNAIDPFSVFAGPAVKEGVDKAKEWWYAEQEQGKRTINKHLKIQTQYSNVARGCNESFSQDCAMLAKHFEAIEKHNTMSNDLRCIEHQIKLFKQQHDTTELEANAQALQTAQANNTSYCESLSSEEQQQLFALERRLVIAHAQLEEYQQELKKLHIALHQ